MDKDGYPEEQELERIRKWAYHDFHGLFLFIRGLWTYPQLFFEHEDLSGVRYELSTGGWSGHVTHSRIDDLPSSRCGRFRINLRRGGGGDVVEGLVMKELIALIVFVAALMCAYAATCLIQSNRWLRRLFGLHIHIMEPQRNSADWLTCRQLLKTGKVCGYTKHRNEL